MPPRITVKSASGTESRALPAIAACNDAALMMANPMVLPITGLRLLAEASHTMATCWPAAWLVASSPFFWAPPLWVLAMMASSSTDPHGGVAGSTATVQESRRQESRW